MRGRYHRGAWLPHAHDPQHVVAAFVASTCVWSSLERGCHLCTATSALLLPMQPLPGHGRRWMRPLSARGRHYCGLCYTRLSLALVVVFTRVGQPLDIAAAYVTDLTPGLDHHQHGHRCYPLCKYDIQHNLLPPAHFSSTTSCLRRTGAMASSSSPSPKSSSVSGNADEEGKQELQGKVGQDQRFISL
ncbi:hypothetical protein B296_00011708 [Ensete ventricosum]|uniref:Uncharacterized protein n=1 Tax=Ensete ventricosum TaxID=4639 RepID=A0A426Z9Y5_ENSVE|nr:hypothetical protein B296_00011708 [Ensete ventricosum]